MLIATKEAVHPTNVEPFLLSKEGLDNKSGSSAQLVAIDLSQDEIGQADPAQPSPLLAHAGFDREHQNIWAHEPSGTPVNGPRCSLRSQRGLCTTPPNYKVGKVGVVIVNLLAQSSISSF